MSFMKEFDHLKIPMEDILLATNNFNPTKLIGRGGFGQVYKGELSLSKGKTQVAFKRLDRRLGQGNIEFWKEIMMLSKYKHENLVSLLHFCIQGDDMILVYEYASRGSLDRYLNDPSLTWRQRLGICVGAARALHYLHDPKETHQRLIHRDIKSSNILLDENWTAKVSDFGLSKVGPANQQQTYLLSNAVGTHGYCDPLYSETGILSKESDVYSFGVVLFEVICGRLCCEYLNGELTSIFVPKWRKWYEEKRLDEIIFLDLKEQMESSSLDSFIDIAYRCIKKTREERPMMVEVVKELEFALEQQEIFETIAKRVDFQELVIDLALPPSSYGSLNQLFMLLLKGILVDNGKTLLSINKNGETCETISAIKCVSSDTPQVAAKSSRFSNVIKYNDDGIKLKVSTQFLIPHTRYTINLVFDKSEKTHNYLTDLGTLVSCRYKLDEETYYVKPYNAIRREDGWLEIRLYEFISNQKKHDFRIDILWLLNYKSQCFIESIEFRPMKKETCENAQHGNTIDIELLSKSDMNFKEAYLLGKDLFMDNGEKWLSLSKNMTKRLMTPVKEFFHKKKESIKMKIEELKDP